MGEHDLKRRLLIVEDDRFTGALLADVLQSHGFEVRVEPSAAAARAAMDTYDPDGALIDIQLGDGPSGVALAHLIHDQFPEVALAFLTRFPDQHAAGLVDADIPEGCGFLRKDKVADSDYLLTVLEQVLTDHGDDVRDDLSADRPLGALTPMQLDVLRLVATGLTNAAIARQRRTSESAVEQALTSIIKTLEIPIRGDVNPRMEMARRYILVAGLPERP